MYQCEAASINAFIQQLAVSHVAKGYWFYVEGEIPAGKCPTKVDAKITARYGLNVSKWARARRKRLGKANVQYLRFARWFVIIATKGTHAFFDLEPRFRDIRRHPFRLGSYSVGCRLVKGRWRASVRIERLVFRALMRSFHSAALGDGDSLSSKFRSLDFSPYAPVRGQYVRLWAAVNARRRRAGLEGIPISVLKLQRRHAIVFAPQHERKTLPVSSSDSAGTDP